MEDHLNTHRLCILGATGPTGRSLGRLARSRGYRVRVVSRDPGHLEKSFPGDEFERFPADLLQPHEAAASLEEQEIVFDCVGLPGDMMHGHPVIAENIARAVHHQGSRCFQVSSFWSYLPVDDLPLRETHPRRGGSEWIRLRRQAEDILLSAGASVLHLPDFYGPWVHTSVLQNPLKEAVAGTTVNWIGASDVAREHVHVGDAMQAALDLAEARAEGGRWIVPGAGPLTADRLAAILEQELDRPVKIRTAGYWTLRLVSLFNRDLRGFMQLVPHYLKPIAYDASKLENEIGKISMRPYEQGIPETVQWLKQQG